MSHTFYSAEFTHEVVTIYETCYFTLARMVYELTFDFHFI